LPGSGILHKPPTKLDLPQLIRSEFKNEQRGKFVLCSELEQQGWTIEAHKKADRGHSLKARWRGHDQHERNPSTGRRPIVIKTAAEPHGAEASS